MDFDIHGAIAMLLMNGVNFRTLHGVDYKGETKVCIIAELSSATVRLDFGDLKHGRRVSRIYEVGDYKKAIKAAAFRAEVSAYKPQAEWRSGSVLPS